MAFSVDEERSIHAISRKSFEKAAKEAGLGTKMAMNCFHAMVSGFKRARISAGKELKYHWQSFLHPYLRDENGDFTESP
ncbi:MAG: hypothetical protein LUE24_07410 [Lachnospiraceae bacterium]|nr:hypothetical protein [Lachnospiraceae bacterium]